jgi:hypothetical protein
MAFDRIPGGNTHTLSTNLTIEHHSTIAGVLVEMIDNA